MIQLIKWLIFGKICNHEWKCDKSLRPFNNDERHLYICQKCGKIKNIRIKIPHYL